MKKDFQKYDKEVFLPLDSPPIQYWIESETAVFLPTESTPEQKAKATMEGKIFSLSIFYAFLGDFG